MEGKDDMQQPRHPFHIAFLCMGLGTIHTSISFKSLPELVISPCSYMESLHVNEQAVRNTTARRFILDTDIG